MTPANHSVDDLRKEARERIRRGLLPGVKSPRFWGGKGMNAPCALCGEPITIHEIECEVEADGGSASYHFHLLCHELWQHECS